MPAQRLSARAAESAPSPLLPVPLFAPASPPLLVPSVGCNRALRGVDRLRCRSLRAGPRHWAHLAGDNGIPPGSLFADESVIHRACCIHRAGGRSRSLPAPPRLAWITAPNPVDRVGPRWGGRIRSSNALLLRLRRQASSYGLPGDCRFRLRNRAGIGSVIGAVCRQFPCEFRLRCGSQMLK